MINFSFWQTVKFFHLFKPDKILKKYISSLSLISNILIYDKLSVSSNKFSITDILSILKADISRYFKSLHPENILSILLTFNVLKCDKSRIFKDEHPSKIDFIFVTNEVSKLDKSIDSNEPHP